MKKYENVRHMCSIKGINETRITPHFYLPHHAAAVEISLIAKVKVIFDGSTLLKKYG